MKLEGLLTLDLACQLNIFRNCGYILGVYGAQFGVLK